MRPPFCDGLTKSQCKDKLKHIKSTPGAISAADKTFVLRFWQASQGADMVQQLCSGDDINIVVHPSPSGKYMGLYAQKEGGKRVSIITHTASVHTFLIRRALRQAVAHQTNAFRDTRKNDSGYVCAKCERNLQNGDVSAHVDHYEVSFARLKQQFFELENVSEWRVKYKTVDNVVVNLADVDLHARWCKFHAEHAQLRMLCAPCNMAWRERYDTTPVILLDFE